MKMKVYADTLKSWSLTESMRCRYNTQETMSLPPVRNIVIASAIIVLSCFSSLTATIIPTLLWGWPRKAWPESLTNQLARPNVRQRLGKESNLFLGAGGEESPWDF